MAALSADLREWTELRIALVQRKVEGVVGIVERFQHLETAIVPGVVGAVLAILGLMFLLVTAALGLGWLLGRPFWGFLIMTGLLLLSGLVLIWIAKRRYDQAQAIVAQAKRTSEEADTLTRKELQDAQASLVRRSAA